MEMIWMTMEEIRKEADAGTPVIIPFGSTEEHGSHLPLATDTLQAEAVAIAAAGIERAIVAPPVHYGLCTSTRNHPGTVTVSGDTFRAMVRDLIRSFSGQGLIKIILFSGHAGRVHMSSLREAATDCVQENPSLELAIVSDFELVVKSSSELVKTHGDSHAGEIETSRMLYLYPDSVKGTSPAESPAFPPYRIVSDPEKYWPGGVWGDPGAADPERGKTFVERSAEELASIVRGLARPEGSSSPD